MSYTNFYSKLVLIILSIFSISVQSQIIDKNTTSLSNMIEFQYLNQFSKTVYNVYLLEISIFLYMIFPIIMLMILVFKMFGIESKDSLKEKSIYVISDEEDKFLKNFL